MMLDQCGDSGVWLQEPGAEEEDCESQLNSTGAVGVPDSTVSTAKVNNATKIKSLLLSESANNAYN